MTNNKMKSAAIAAGIVAGAVTVMLLNRRTRQETGAWVDEMSEELKRRLKETKDITQEKYNQIIDEIKPKYEAIKSVDSQEINELIEELKSHWKTISQEVKKQASDPGKNKKIAGR